MINRSICHAERSRSIYSLLWAVAALLLAACAPETLDDNGQQNVPPLRPGERTVNLSLNGLAGNGAVDTRSASIASATRATNENLTLAGECDIETLLIACFADKDEAGNTVTNLDEYTLERLYTYRKQGDKNDFLLLSDANGYHAGIGVPENDDRKRVFLLFANPMNQLLTTDMPTYAVASALKLQVGSPTGLSTRASDGAHLRISCPLPMGARATHRVISSNGTITDEPVFTQTDLERGLSARMIRRVSRIDLLNPDITGFEVEGMRIEAPITMPYFGESAETTLSGDDYNPVYLTNAEEIPGACYLFPAALGTPGTPGTPGTKVKITLTGTLMGAPDQTLKAEAVMKPNTRYLLRVRNDESNVRVEIEVADWDTGEDIATEDVSGKLNTGCTVGLPESSNTTLDKERHTIYVAPASEIIDTRRAIVQLTGAAGDINPIGVIIPDDCDWLEAVTAVDEEKKIRMAFLLATEEEQAAAGGKSSKIETIVSRFKRPHTVPVSFVSRTADGKLCFDTYELTVDVDPPWTSWEEKSPVKAVIVGEGYWRSLVRVDDVAHTVHLPSVSDVAFSVRGYQQNQQPAAFTSAYLSRDCGWLEWGMEDATDKDKHFTVSLANFTGEDRVTELITGFYNENSPTKMEQPWTVVQESGYDENLLAADALLKLPLREQEELWMTGNVIGRSGLSIGDLVGSAEVYGRYVELVNSGGDVSTVEAIQKKLAEELEKRSDANGDKGDIVGYIYPSDSSPVEVTTDVPWINITYKLDATDRLCAVLDLTLYLPTTREALEKQAVRSGTVTVHLRGGRTQTYIIRQEPAKA